MDRAQLLVRGATAVIARKTLLIAVTLVVFAAAFVSSFFRTPPRTAEVILAVTNFRAGTELGAFLPEDLTAKSYEPLLKSQAVLGETRRRLIEQNAWGNDEPPGLTVFSGSLRAVVRTVDETTRPVTYSPYISLLVTGPEDLAKQIADTWGTVAVEVANRTTHMRVGLAADTVTQQAGAYRETLESLWNELAREEGEGNTAVLTAQLTGIVDRLTKLEEDLVTYQRAREGAARQAAALRAELDKETRVLTVLKAPSDDVYWLRQSEGADDALQDLSARAMKTEILNDIYASIRSHESLALEKMTEAEGQIAEITQAIERLTQEKEQLQVKLASHTYRQKELTAKADIYKGVFAEIDKVRLLADAAAQMTRPSPEIGKQPVGLNRISDEIYTVRAGAMSNRARIGMATVLAFLATLLYIVAEAFSQEMRQALGLSPRSKA